MILPLPAGKGVGGMGARKQTKGGFGRQAGKQAPRRMPDGQVEPVPRPAQPRGCKGRSPLHKKTMILPLPAGKGVGGMGARKQTKGGFGRQAGKQAPRRMPDGQVEPVPRPAQPRGCKGRSPLHKKTMILPLPAGEERSASAGRGDILPLRGRGAGKKAKGRGSRRPKSPRPLTKQQKTKTT